MPGQLKLKRSITTLVLSNCLSIDPAFGQPVASAYYQKNTHSFPFRWNCYLPFVPGDIIFIFHFTKRRPPWKRNQYFLCEFFFPIKPTFCFTLVCSIKFKLPITIQIYPIGSFKIRPRVLRERNAFFVRFIIRTCLKKYIN